MTASHFDITLDSLPQEIPIFPLSQAVLMPRGSLPLNIFEPRYLAMVEYALAHQRIIGMVQPKAASRFDGDSPRAVYAVGCAGRISSFSETGDGRLLISLSGVCRYHIEKELPLHEGGFRMVEANWQQFAHDLIPDTQTEIDHEKLNPLLQQFLATHDMVCDKGEEMARLNSEELIACLSLICPFDSRDKQMLLEAETLPKRIEVMTGLMEMEIHRKTRSENHH